MTYDELKERIIDNEADWESFFNDLSDGFAILQVKFDLPERRNIQFCSYNKAVKYLERKPCRDDYYMLSAEALTQSELANIYEIFPKRDKKIAIGEYVFNKFNSPSRPGIDDGYYGTSLSMSDVILIKERKSIQAFYVDTFGFKKIDGFEPYKFLKPEGRGNDHER